MSVIPYIIALFAFAIFYLTAGNPLHLSEYGVALSVTLVVTGIIHYYMKRNRCYATEYLGSYAWKIRHEDSWTEIEEYTEEEPCGKDSNGNTRYRTVYKKRYIYHPHQWLMITSIGSEYSINESQYDYIAGLWGTERHDYTITGSHIKGGIRFADQYHFEDVESIAETLPLPFNPLYNEYLRARIYNITETHKYKNKIRNSNSVFKFENISKDEAIESGLYDYPDIINNDQNPICGSVDLDTEQLYRCFNAAFGEQYQFRLFVLIFDASKGVETAQKQQAYWKGGNKNEMTVCIGLSEGIVKWCYTFSWADEPTLETKTSAYFLEHKKLDLKAYLYWLDDNIKYWKRKEFADFDYISVSLSQTQITWLIVISAILNAVAIYFCLCQN